MKNEANSGEIDVLIVGAGPTGLTLACDLARRGLTLRVVDRAPAPCPGSRGKGLTPRTLEVFDDLGVADAVLAGGQDYPRLRLHLGFIRLPLNLSPRRKRSPSVPFPNMWMHPQNRTEAALRARLAELGGTVEMGTEVTAFEQDDDAVIATLARADGQERVRARYLVGADGAHSIVRKTLGIAFEGSRLEEPCAIVGDVRLDGLSTDAWHIWPRTKEGAIGLCPLPERGLFQLYVQRPLATNEEATEASVRALLANALGAKAPRILEVGWLSLFRPSARLANRYRVGRVFLAGDAAHVHPPTGAQGMNTGIQDAYNLGWKLTAVLQGAPAALLDTYEEERRPIAASVLGVSTALLRKRSMRRGEELKQLRTNYRGCSLAPQKDRRASVRAGDRARDAEGCTPDGARVRLFDSFRGPHATLIGFGPAVARELVQLSKAYDARVVLVSKTAHAPVEGATLFVEAKGRLQASYGVREGFVVVRPDGYVGLVGGHDELALADAYLRGTLPTKSVAFQGKRPTAETGPRGNLDVGRHTWEESATLTDVIGRAP